MYVTEKCGKRQLSELRKQEVSEHHGSLLETGMSHASADHVFKLLQQMMNKAVEWDVIPVSPIAGIKLFNKDNRLENYLDQSDLQRLLVS